MTAANGPEGRGPIVPMNTGGSSNMENALEYDAIASGVFAPLYPVVAEAIQTILRREGYPHPYEALKALTRTNERMTEATIHEFIQNLDVSERLKAELMAITPSNYTGI